MTNIHAMTIKNVFVDDWNVLFLFSDDVVFSKEMSTMRWRSNSRNLKKHKMARTWEQNEQQMIFGENMKTMIISQHC